MPSHYLNQCWNIVNWTPGTNFNEIVIENHTCSFTKMHLKMLSASADHLVAILSRPQCVNTLCPSEDIWRPSSWSSLVQVITGHLFSFKPLPDLIVNWTLFKLEFKYKILIKENAFINESVKNVDHGLTHRGQVALYGGIDLGQHCLVATSHYLTQCWLIISKSSDHQLKAISAINH